MKLSKVKNSISTLMIRKGITLYDGFSSKAVEISKTTAFLYPPTLEKEKKVLDTTENKVNFIRSYRFNLEIMGKNITPSLADELLKLVDIQNDFYDVKLLETTISKTTSLPRFFIEFKTDEISLENYTKSEKAHIFSGLGVKAFVDGISFENDLFTPQITLIDGTIHYGETVYRGRIYTLKLSFSNSAEETFIIGARDFSNGTQAFEIDSESLTPLCILKAEITSQDNYETKATLSFKTV